MILEVALLDIGKGTCEEFEAAMRKAAPLIASAPGYISHEVRRCREKANRYILLVHWETLEAHTVGFRQSPQYAKWRALLHHFYDPFPIVEHYGEAVVSSSRPASGAS
ncbi:MAG TPA: antibiotic biosynthesis monooxygenase [Alphaproteobacteria bacterium]|nr:antibiotic biosynthesis monooxygenase [Alphaproteobacteria bacterium]